MLLEGPVLFLGFASVALAMFVWRAARPVRDLQPQPLLLRPAVLRMSRVENTPIAGLSREAQDGDAREDVRRLPSIACALLILLGSVLCYGLGYFAIAALF
jgi:hypothetical protein